MAWLAVVRFLLVPLCLIQELAWDPSCLGASSDACLFKLALLRRLCVVCGLRFRAGLLARIASAAFTFFALEQPFSEADIIESVPQSKTFDFRGEIMKAIQLCC